VVGVTHPEAVTLSWSCSSRTPPIFLFVGRQRDSLLRRGERCLLRPFIEMGAQAIADHDSQQCPDHCTAFTTEDVAETGKLAGADVQLQELTPGRDQYSMPIDTPDPALMELRARQKPNLLIIINDKSWLAVRCDPRDPLPPTCSRHVDCSIVGSEHGHARDIAINRPNGPQRNIGFVYEG
jgi:hypothetical protein